jgi:hypothetical protein
MTIEATATTPAAPATAADYQQAAAALLQVGETETQTTQAPAEPAAETAEGGATADPPSDKTASAPSPEEKKAPEEEKPSEPEPEKKAEEPMRRGFDTLAREKAALRKQQQELDTLKEKYAKFDQAADPMSALLAKGYTYKQLVEQILAGKVPETKPAEARADDPVLKKVEALEQMLTQERAQARRAQAYAKAVELAPAEKFPFVAAKGAHATALEYLESYYNDTGEMPGANVEESISMALEAVETALEREARSWEALLTKAKPRTTGTVGGSPTKEAAPQAASSQARAVSKTLTNAQVAPASHTTQKPQTPEDYQRLALSILETSTG